MNKFQLTLNDLEPITFWSDNSQLKSRLNMAYITFKNKHNLNRAFLYVHHPIQGWCQVYNINNAYREISNPLVLDYHELIIAIIHTLSRAKLIPTAQQKREKREKDLQADRNIDAEIKRSAFHIIKTDH